MNTQKVLVSGASGLIGTSLVRDLAANSIQVVQLIRDGQGVAEGGRRKVGWNPLAADPVSDYEGLAGIDAAVHLSGAPVAGHRWSEAYKQEIVSSRVQSTLALVRVLRRLDPRPRVLVCASAIGIFGDRGDEVLTEESAPGTGFLADTCKAWETAAETALTAGIRVVQFRFGVVLSPTGGALAQMLALFRLGLGGRLGSGRQWTPWLTLRDAVAMLRYCLQEDAIHGPVNAVAPNPVTNAEFTVALAAAIHRPAMLSVPAFAVKLMFGEMAREMLLASVRVVPAKLAAGGFRFADPEIGAAFGSLFKR